MHGAAYIGRASFREYTLLGISVNRGTRRCLTALFLDVMVEARNRRQQWTSGGKTRGRGPLFSASADGRCVGLLSLGVWNHSLSPFSLSNEMLGD